MHVRIESTGTSHGTRVIDSADGHEVTNVVAVRFEHRVHHLPIVVLELQGGQLMVNDSVLGLAETAVLPEGPNHAV